VFPQAKEIKQVHTTTWLAYQPIAFAYCCPGVKWSN
jgi:hypothetical protein